MTKTLVKPRTKVKPKTQRPPLYKVILLNDDYTPPEFVVQVLKAVFRDERGPGLPGDDDRAPARRLRDRGLHPRRGRDQGQGGHRVGQEQGLSAVLHHRAGRIGRSLPPRTSRWSGRELETLEPVQRLFDPCP